MSAVDRVMDRRKCLLRAAALGSVGWLGTGVVQAGGQSGLVLTLDGVTLCVVPLGPRAEPVHDAMVA